MILERSFQVVSTSGSQSWNGVLYRYLEECRGIAEMLRFDIEAGRLEMPSCVVGQLSAEAKADIATINREYPIELKAPFEEVASVAGAIWHSSRLLLNDDEDALLKLHFEAGTTSLPIHSHEYSDRVIVALEGRGTFLARLAGRKEEVGEIEVLPGTVLAFPRGLKHTFRTEADSLTLLSYHSPFIPLDDPRQYKLA